MLSRSCLFHAGFVLELREEVDNMQAQLEEAQQQIQVRTPSFMCRQTSFSA